MLKHSKLLPGLIDVLKWDKLAPHLACVTSTSESTIVACEWVVCSATKGMIMLKFVPGMWLFLLVPLLYFDPRLWLAGMFLGYIHQSGKVHIMDNNQWVSCPSKNSVSSYLYHLLLQYWEQANTYVSLIIPLETETWSIILTHCRWVQEWGPKPLSPRWINLVQENGVASIGYGLDFAKKKTAIGVDKNFEWGVWAMDLVRNCCWGKWKKWWWWLLAGNSWKRPPMKKSWLGLDFTKKLGLGKNLGW